MMAPAPGTMHGSADDQIRGGKRIAFTIVALLISAALLEGGSAAIVTLLTKRGWMAYIPRFTSEQISYYLAAYDPVLGWAFTGDTTWGRATDESGRVVRAWPRKDPARPANASPCVSTYGDSFTYGTEVGDDGAYPHYLTEMLGCPVSNFGVPGYGSDQAFMLFRSQEGIDTAPVVVIAHLTENILRNVNRYANLLYPGSPLRFKPRFVLAGDSVRYLAAPVRDPSDFTHLENDPEAVLAPDGLLERPRPRFPFTIALIDWLVRDLKVRARLTGAPVETPLYDPGHPAGGFALTVALLSRAASEIHSSGRRPVILLLSTRQALLHARKTGRWIDGPLSDTLKARGLPVIHAGPAILAAIGGRDPCLLFMECSQTHFNAAGNRIVAGLVAAYLDASAMVADPAPPAILATRVRRGPP